MMQTAVDKPVFPIFEYPERWRKTQAMMAAQDLVIAVAYADDRAVFGPAHARWFANFPVHFEPLSTSMSRKCAAVMLAGPAIQKV